ncbi:hypothetical protein P8452_44333 [Trifolium repens]|nr:hypothetical protein P8452_44333 [Trifolium repens]
MQRFFMGNPCILMFLLLHILQPCVLGLTSFITVTQRKNSRKNKGAARFGSKCQQGHVVLLDYLSNFQRWKPLTILETTVPIVQNSSLIHSIRFLSLCSYQKITLNLKFVADGVFSR